MMLCEGAGPSAPDLIRFDCPATSVSPMAVRVMIGPTTSNDIYGVKFDVLFDPAVVRFFAPAIEGNFLDQDGSSTIMQAEAPPSDPGRLVVSVSRVGEVGGVGGQGGERTIISLPFATVGAGATPLHFENAEAVDSALLPVADIHFSDPIEVTSP